MSEHSCERSRCDTEAAAELINRNGLVALGETAPKKETEESNSDRGLASKHHKVTRVHSLSPFSSPSPPSTRAPSAPYALPALFHHPSRPQYANMPGAPSQRQFNPYSENGGTILAIAGQDFSVVAGDTRQSEGYSIQTRYAPKVFRLCVFPPLVIR